MPITTQLIKVKADGKYLDGTRAYYSPDTPRGGQPIIDFEITGSVIPVGNGTFLTAAHNFDAIKLAEDGKAVRFTETSYQIEGTPATGFTPLRNWDALTVYQNSPPRIMITNGADLASVQSNFTVSDNAIAPFIVFADNARLQNFFSNRSQVVSTQGELGGTTNGQFDGVSSNGEFLSTNTVFPGDSGGATYINFLGQDYIAGVISVGTDTEVNGEFVPSPGTRSTYLMPVDFYNLMARVSSGSGNDFTGTPPDLIFGSSGVGGYFRGTSRRASFQFNGDDSAILLGSGSDIANSGSGTNSIIFTQAALGGGDTGEELIVSPGSDAIIGGSSNDRLLILADRLWNSQRGSPSQSNLRDNSDTIQIRGGVVQYASDGTFFGLYSPSYARTEGEATAAYENGGYYFVYFRSWIVDGRTDLIIRVAAMDGSSAQNSGAHYGTGYDSNLWTSTMTIRDFHNGDLGLNFIASPGTLYHQGSWNSFNQIAPLSTRVPQPSDIANNDVTDNWNGVQSVFDLTGYNPSQSEIDSQLANILAMYHDDSTPTPPPTSTNHAPVAVADSGAAGENESKFFDLVANDTDVDAGDTRSLASFSVRSVTGVPGNDATAVQAAFSIEGGQLRFTPGTQFDELDAGQSATVVLDYVVRDRAGAQSTGIFTLTVAGADESPSNDTINGGPGNDTLVGGSGNDTIYGQGGDDTYLYSRGDGDDYLSDAGSFDGGHDRLLLHGIDPSTVVVERNGDDAILAISASAGGPASRVTLGGQIEPSYDKGIEQIVFDNGTVWSSSDIRQMVLVQSSSAGNDTITGFNGSETMTGGAGNDLLYGRDGNDTLVGGAGNDTVYGQGGDDTYLYTRGDGDDYLSDAGSFDGGHDRLLLHGIDPSTVAVERNGDDAILVISASATGPASRVTLGGQIEPSYDKGIEQLVFDNGITWSSGDIRQMVLAQSSSAGNDTITGFNGSETMTGGAGNDLLYGRDGNDTLVGGPGNDTVYGQGGDDTYLYSRGDGDDYLSDAGSFDGGHDRLLLTDIASGDVSVALNGDDIILLISSSAGGGRITLGSQYAANYDKGIEQLVFADGTIWNADVLRSQAALAGDSGGGTGNDRPPYGA